MKTFPFIFKISLVGLFTYLFYFTLSLKITLFDAYDYMVMAKYNAGFHGWYPFLQFLRPPLLPALLTPLASLHHYGVSMETIFTLMHLFSLLISGGFVLASYFLFRKGLRPEFAALGALLLMIQPGFVAYSFETMADIPAGLLMIFSVFIYLSYRKNQNNSQLIFLCFVIGLGVAMKYPMVLAPLVFIGAKMIVSIVERKTWKDIIGDNFYLKTAFLSAILYITISVLSLLPVHGWTFENVYRSIQPYLDHIPTVQETEESMVTNTSFLYSQMTAPLFLLMCTGLLMAWRRKTEFNIVMFTWLVVFLSVPSVIGAHYEYRYLFPLIPACYFFCAFAIQELFDYAQNRWSDEKRLPLGASVVLILLMALPALGFAREIKFLNSGFYQNDFHRRVVRTVEKGGNYYWFGAIYAMYRKDAPFHSGDPYYKIYHFWLNGINFFTNKRPSIFIKNMTADQGGKLRKGDILIYNTTFASLQTNYLPEPNSQPGLNIGKINTVSYTLKNESSTEKIFSNQEKYISLSFDRKNTINVKISNKINLSKYYFVLFKLKTTPKDYSQQTLFPLKKGFVWYITSNENYFKNIKEIMLINFDSEEFHYNKAN